MVSNNITNACNIFHHDYALFFFDATRDSRRRFLHVTRKHFGRNMRGLTFFPAVSLPYSTSDIRICYADLFDITLSFEELQ